MSPKQRECRRLRLLLKPAAGATVDYLLHSEVNRGSVLHAALHAVHPLARHVAHYCRHARDAVTHFGEQTDNPWKPTQQFAIREPPGEPSNVHCPAATV